MNAPRNAVIALSALASVVFVTGGAIALLEKVDPGPALIRVTEGRVDDCDGAGAEVFGGRDRDRSGALTADETELTGILCNVGGRLEVGYEPEPCEDPPFGRKAGAPRARVLMEFRDHPWARSCPEGGVLVVVGMDGDHDALLSAAEVSDKRALCRAPSPPLYARTR
jgi:hypothetical protein